MNIEREFSEIDFSTLSAIKESLRSKLLKERKRRIELFEEDLDFLAAAGNNQKNIDKTKNCKDI